jgi:GTP-binding protein EngB required for normal cell division
MSDYQQHKQQILQLFDKAIAFAQAHKLTPTFNHLAEAQKHLLEGKLFIVVAGEFKQGKSSLLNAFLNETEIFPVDIDITTNLVSTITYGKAEKITVVLGESGQETVKQIQRSEIPEYVTEQRNAKNAKQAKMLIVESPNSQLQEGLVLVDTPGIGSLNTEHTAITYAFLPNADAVLFVSDALKPLTTEELDFLKTRILPHCQNIIFVLTKADTVSDIQEIITNNQQKLAQVLNCDPKTITIVPVSSRAKLDYLQYQEPEDLEYSNFPQLEQQLWQLVGEQRGQTLLLKAVNELNQAIGEMKAPLEVAWSADQNRTPENLEAQLIETQEKLRNLLENNAEWRNILSDRLQNLQIETQGQFQRNFAQIRYQTSEYIEDDRLINSPKQIADLVESDIDGLMSNLNKDLNQQAADLYGEIETVTRLDLTRFEVGFAERQKAHLVREEIKIEEKTVADKAWNTSRNAVFSSSAGGTIGGIVGGIAGGVLGFVFGAGVGAAPGVQVGAAIGGAIGWIGGGAKGVKDGLAQIEEKDRATAKSKVTRVIAPFLDDCQRICNQTLVKAIKGLEHSMRDEFTKQVKRQKEGWEKTLRSLQESRKLSPAQVAQRSQQLPDSLEQLSQLQAQVQTITQTIIQQPITTPPLAAPEKIEAKVKPPETKTVATASSGVDYGDWADE